MKLVPKDWDQYNPVLVAMGAVFLLGGGYVLIMMPGPPIVWAVKGVFAVGFAIGLIMLIRQIQLWRRREINK